MFLGDGMSVLLLVIYAILFYSLYYDFNYRMYFYDGFIFHIISYQYLLCFCTSVSMLISMVISFFFSLKNPYNYLFSFRM